MFGEVFDADPRFMSQYTTEGRLQATVDFGFQGSGVNFAKGKRHDRAAATSTPSTTTTPTPTRNAYSLPTFLGNHDMGRVGSFLRQGTTAGTTPSCSTRDELAHSLMYLTRGQPVVYYGDEQGFSAPPDVPGGIGDQRAREDMFASQVDLHNDTYDLIGTDATTADANFDTGHPLYEHIADLAELREEHPALADGAQVHRYADDGPGIFAFSRIDADEQRRVRRRRQQRRHRADGDLRRPTSRRAACSRASGRRRHRRRRVKTDAEGRVTVTVPPLSAVRLPGQRRAPRRRRRARRRRSPRPAPAAIVTGRAEVGGRRPGERLHPGDRSPGARSARTEWQLLGTDDNAPYRVFHDVRGLPRARPSSTAPSPATTTATSAWSRPAPSSGSPSRRPTPASSSGRSPSRMPSRCPAATAARSAARADWDPPCDAASS